MTTDTTTTEPTPTTTEPTPEARALVALVNLRALLAGLNPDGTPTTPDTGAPVPSLASLSRWLHEDVRRSVDNAERAIAEALPPIWVGYVRDLANFDRTFAAEVEAYRDGRYSRVDVSELRKTDDDGREGDGFDGWTILRGSSRYEVREVERFEAREAPRFKASRRASGVYTVSDLAATAPSLAAGFEGSKDEARDEADRLNAQPDGKIWEVYDYDGDEGIDLDDYAADVREVLNLTDPADAAADEDPDIAPGFESMIDEEPPEIGALTEAEARAVAAMLNERHTDDAPERWIVWDSDNRERASGGALEECGREDYDTKDESEATEAAQAANVEAYRESANGWPWAQNSGYPIDEREADDFGAAGFVVATHEPSGQTYAGIDGGGYGFTDAHWAPLMAQRAAGRFGWPVRTSAGLRRFTTDKASAAPRWIVEPCAGAWDVTDTIRGWNYGDARGKYATEADARAEADARNARGY